MIAIQTHALARSIDGLESPAHLVAWRAVADLMNDLLRGGDDLEAVADLPFQDTMPAVCWAVPGAYASSVDS